MPQREDMHALFDAAPDTILVADDDRRYVYANRAAEELLGIRVEEILRLRVEDIADAEPQVVRDLWASFLEQGSLRGEFVVRRPDGTRRATDFHARANFRPGLHSSILRELAHAEAGRLDRRAQLLTPREREILSLVADGHTSQGIADRLGITRRTVDTHRTNMNRKLGLRSVAALTRFALEHGLVSDSR